MKVLTLMEESPAFNVTNPSIRAGVEAAVERINCQGGLGAAGSPVEVTFCQSNFDPNAVNACASDAIDDDAFVAAIGGSVGQGDAAKMFADAGMLSIPQGASASDVDAASSTTFIPNLGTGYLLGPSEPVMGCQLGYEKISLLLVQFPTSAQVTELDDAALESHGCPPLTRTVLVPGDATDVSAQVTAASEGVDAVVVAVAPAQAVSVLKTREQLDIDVPFISNGGTMNADTVRAVGASAEGLLLGTPVYLPPADASVPGSTQFRADMTAIDEDDLVDTNSASAWLTFDLLATAADGLATIDRASLLEAITTVSSYDGGGMMEAVDFSAPVPDPAFPRLFGGSFTPMVIQDGELHPEPTLERFIPNFIPAG